MPIPSDSPFAWVCPECRGPLEQTTPETVRCPSEGIEFGHRDGVLSLLTGTRFERYRQFIADYRTVRADEGRGVADIETYRALPFADLTGRHRDEWRIRSVSFDALRRRVVEPLARSIGRLAVADLGAGNGWLSRRLALEGHSLAALDILTDSADGLGAARLSEVQFETAQAEFDRLPLADASVDLAVFNGSLHYSTNYARTLGEALRVLRPAGAVAVIDSPFYQCDRSGAKMVEERRHAFVKRYGFASDSIPCRGYLSFPELDTLAEVLGLRWRIHRPFYGLRWALRPLASKLRGHREPATFLVLWAKKEPGTNTGYDAAIGSRRRRVDARTPGFPDPRE